MWALGCILYEMTCLQKAFEGENLPALVNKIMTCQYAPVRGPYTTEVKVLIRELLQLDPAARPCAADALRVMLRPQIRAPSISSQLVRRATRSTLYKLDPSSIILRPVEDLPKKIVIKKIAVSCTHTMMLSFDNEVFAWGWNNYGQLGLGDTAER
ncbi:unnamed protein product [Strongylus vulgaris]|uniref:non-specific serine/threonine protein kinase n=1 Tax=Strongylus vulgaris TaxID=40348 RepID=A0A3P7ISV4_STRVU|nr:unnamed protein product [Strongylus vulgaris]